MNRFAQITLAAAMLLAPLTAAHAQLVTVDKHYTIKNVDVAHNRLAVKYLNASHEPVKEQLLVDIDGKTQVFAKAGQPMKWTNLQPNMEIEVKGGLEDSLHIKAKTIMVVHNHV